VAVRTCARRLDIRNQRVGGDVRLLGDTGRVATLTLHGDYRGSVLERCARAEARLLRAPRFQQPTQRVPLLVTFTSP